MAKNKLGMAITGLGMATEAVKNATNMAELPENNYQESVDDLNTRDFNTGSYDDLANLINSTSLAKTNYNRSDVLGMTGGQAAGQIIGNAFNGAAFGLTAGGLTPAGGIMAATNGVLQTIASGIGYGIRKGKASRQAQQLNYEGQAANQNTISKINNAAMDIGKNTRNTEFLNLAAFGGPLDTTFTNGVRFITEGGSHESNPLSGVPQGIAADGIPNLVEEGEVIYNDYVYSRRLKVPQADKESLGLKKNKEYTYADAAKQIQKESEERPNDPISKRNLAEMMGRLQGSQEALKEKRDVQAFKRAVNKMTPDELAMFMQQLQQPQQMQPMMAMQNMQSMQPTQSEVPMFGKGGHLFALGDNLNWNYQSPLPNLQAAYEEGLFSDLGERFQQAGINAGVNVFDTTKAPKAPEPTYNTMLEGEAREAGRNFAPVKQDNVSNTDSTIQSNPWAQALRAAPVFGSIGSTIASLFDKPNYSNTERAEKAMSAVPRVSTTPIGQRMSYNPMDINYLATQQTNNALGARRALSEYGAGNPAGTQQAQIANNYTNQTALGQSIMQANQLNRQNLAQTLEFNRQTDSANAANNMQAALANQQRDMTAADFLMRAGQLRDAELGRVQANRNDNLTNMFNQIGNLGQDMLNRDMAMAMAQSYGVPYNPYMDAAGNTAFGNGWVPNQNAQVSKNKQSADNGKLSANEEKSMGGKLNTKKGGKNA